MVVPYNHRKGNSMSGKTKRKQLTPQTITHDRNKSELNQTDYWGRYGVTQSAGSRYETGRKLPKPLQQLMSTKGANTDEFSSREISPKKALKLRMKLGMNQKEFWALVSVSQSCGCRYEKGRNLPRYLRILLRVVFKELSASVGIKL